MSNPDPQHNEAAQDAAHLEHFKKHIQVCVGVFVALLVLTVITVGISFVHFGKAGNITIALVIATLKASLVAAYFMHLNSEKSAIYRILIFTGVFFMGLMFLTLWTFGDAVKL